MGEEIKKDELNLIKNSVKEKGLRWEPNETGLPKLDVKRIHKYLEIKNINRPIGGEILEN
jgi:hypothetical protein